MFLIDLLAGMFITVSLSAVDTPLKLNINNAEASTEAELVVDKPDLPIEIAESMENSPTESFSAESKVRDPNPLEVPFYSQFRDISSPAWQGKGCGVASLAMIIEYFTGEPVSVDNLLNRGLDSGAYIYGAGWAHQGLINLSQSWGLGGTPQSFQHLSGPEAFNSLEVILEEGPVIASVHYTMEPTNPIPHLAVINDIEGNTVHYNDPAEEGPGNTISKTKFLEAWKKRIIKIRPST